MYFDGIQGMYIQGKKSNNRPSSAKKIVNRLKHVIITKKNYTYKDVIKDEWTKQGSSLTFEEYLQERRNTLEIKPHELLKRFK